MKDLSEFLNVDTDISDLNKDVCNLIKELISDQKRFSIESKLSEMEEKDYDYT